MNKLAALVPAVTGALALILIAPAAAVPPDELQALQAATAPYHSLDQAQAAGYSLEGEPCVQEAPGAMGIHAVNATLAGDLAVDPDRPDILLYLPDKNGDLKLIGVEYFMVALTASGPWFGPSPPPSGFVNPAPSVFGHTFDGPMPGHNPAMPWHYDLHVWVWADNPAGMFAPFNPTLSCPS